MLICDIYELRSSSTLFESATLHNDATHSLFICNILVVVPKITLIHCVNGKNDIWCSTPPPSASNPYFAAPSELQSVVGIR